MAPFGAQPQGGLLCEHESCSQGDTPCTGETCDESEGDGGETAPEDDDAGLRKNLVAKLQHVEDEDLFGVLKRLDSIRQLAGDAMVLRRRENSEETARQLAIDQFYSLLLEEAEFQPQAVMQRGVLAMLEGIKLQHAEIFFFSHDDVRKKLTSGPSVRLRDSTGLSPRFAERLLVTAELLDRMLAELQTGQIRDIVAKSREYVAFKQTSYQVKTLEEKGDALVKGATGFAVYKNLILATDASNHCIWKISVDSFTDQGNHKVEIFAGCVGVPGLEDGPLLRSKFGSPMGLGVSDAAGTAFVCDTDNNTIRRIDLVAGVVTTLELSPTPLAKTYTEAQLTRPKGICIVHAEPDVLLSMEDCLWKQAEQLQEGLGSRQPPPAGAGGEGSRSTSSTSSGEESASFGSTTESTSSGHTASQEGTGITSIQIHDVATSSLGVPMSLEQSLSVEHIKKYAVLHDSEKAMTGPGVTPSTRSSMASTFVRRTPSCRLSTPSACWPGAADDTGEDDAEDDAGCRCMRLAVTTDHCVWLVNPVSGQAQVIAGDPVHYGYRDATLGLNARFSSPKGIIHVRSVLFVADYWNNVVRCINLCTSQVDTVMDFRPQGPVAMCLSGSGVLYTLDSDCIHHANILRIMSTQVEPLAGKAGSCLVAEGRSDYQTLFSNPRTRSSSTWTDSTFVHSEVWDAVRRRSSCRDPGEGFAASASNPGAADPSTLFMPPALLHGDFHSRLEAHLHEAAAEQEGGARKSDGAKKGKKHRRKSREPSGAARLLPECPLSSPAPGTQAADPMASSCSRASSIRLCDVRAEAEERLQPLLGVPAPRPPSSTLAAPLAAPKPQQAPAGGERPGCDYVEEMKMRLSRMASPRVSNACHDDAPLTLSDLGLGNALLGDMAPGVWSSRRGSGFSSSVAPALRRPVRESEMDAAMPAREKASGLGDDNYMIFQENCRHEAVSTPDAGTVMVCGGKAFYRSQSVAWSERKVLVESQAPSRRASELEGCIGSVSCGKRTCGQDEDGEVVNFVDLTFQESRRNSIQSRRSSLSLLDSRRESVGQICCSIGPATAPPQQPSSSSEARRVSFGAESGLDSRRSSKASQLEEADYFPTSLSVTPRRSSIAVSPRRNSMVSQRRNSVGGNPLLRRGSLSVVDSDGIIADWGGGLNPRASTTSCRGSILIMPTVLDNEEGEWMESESDKCAENAAGGDGGEKQGSAGHGPGKRDHHAAMQNMLPGNDASGPESASTETDDEDDSEKEETSSENRSSRDEEIDGTGAGERLVSASSGGLKTPSTPSKGYGTVPTQCEEGKELLFSRMMNVGPDEIGVGAAAGSEEYTCAGSMLATNVVPLAQLPFTRDINVASLSTTASCSPKSQLEQSCSDFTATTSAETFNTNSRRRRHTVMTSATGVQGGSSKVTERTSSKAWRPLSLPEPLSSVAHGGKARRYPNTPLAIVCHERDGECFLLVGLLFAPTLLKVIPPKHHEPDRSGRFNVLPIDTQRFLLADETSHQIWLVNCASKTKTHVAGCGKRGYLDGPLGTCRLNSPCSLALDPHSHHVYIADKGNHAIRKLNLLSGLTSTVVGNGCRGNSDGADRQRQALDSPFEVSFAAPHHLIISCADNAVRSYDLQTGYLETLLIGA